MKRLLGLLAAVLVAGALIGFVARAWRPAPRAAVAETARPEHALAIEITREGIDPKTFSVPKDHAVRLTVTNRRRYPVTFTLAGYEDRLAAGLLEPDSTWTGSFVADRPGEGFAWLVDGAPVGRLDVSGSHLVEGHR